MKPELDTSTPAVAEYDGAALMLQEYIPRCAGQNYFFHGYCDANSRCRPGFVGIKDRSYPAHAGLTSLGRWVDNATLHRQATELISRVGLRGIVDLDYRWDPRDGQYKLLDSNRRLGAQFRLFSDSAGVDVMVAHLDLTGRTSRRACHASAVASSSRTMTASQPMTTQLPARKALT